MNSTVVVKSLVTKLPRLLLLLIVIYLISLNYQRQEKMEQQETTLVIPREKVEKYFSDYAQLEQKSEVLYEVKKEDGVVGKLIVTSPIADKLSGFGGNVPLILYVSLEDQILGLELLENSESPDFIETIAETGFFELWNGKSLREALNLQVDGVSGASMTTDAVTGSVRMALAYHLRTAENSGEVDWLRVLQNILACFVIGFAVLSMFIGGRLKKYRWILLVSSILILGIGAGYFVSFALLFSWLLNGVPFSGRILLVVVVVFAFLFPLLFGKAWYCSYLCPFGATQELVGKARKKKWILRNGIKRVLKYTRMVWFTLVIGGLLLGSEIDLTQLEPFSIFMFTVATRWIIALAVVFLFLSLFLSRPWCNYFCLTGHVLEIFRRGRIEMSVKMMLYEWIALFIFVILLLFILW